MTDRETREALAREVEEKVADLYRSRTRLGVNGGIVHHLGCMLADNAEVILAALRDKPAEPSPGSQRRETEAGGGHAKLIARLREWASAEFTSEADRRRLTRAADALAAQAEENARLRGEIHGRNLYAGDPREWGLLARLEGACAQATAARARALAAEAQRDKLAEALQPFAEAAENLSGPPDAEVEAVIVVPVAELHAARAALADTGGGNDR